MKWKRIPIKAAKIIAKTYNYDQVIVIGRRTGQDGIEYVTTYGVNKEHCDVAAQIGNHCKRLLGWEEK